MLQQTYQFSLNYDIVPGLVTTARLNQGSKTAMLVCVTQIGKILIYTPRQLKDAKDQQSSQFLNLNKKIKHLSTCSFGEDSDVQFSFKQKLLLASENTLFAYDLEENVDKFYKEVQDGISAITYGSVSTGKQSSTQLAIVGGDCSVQGYDQNGEESYWNITGDQVTCLCATQESQEKPPYLLVGSSDSTIRVFLGEEIVFEVVLTSTPTHILEISNNEHLLYAFSLENGAVSAYKKDRQIWLVKDTTKVVGLLEGKWDNDLQDAFKPIVIGREDGSIELRRDTNGELLYKHPGAQSKLAAIVFDDLRGTLTKQLIAVYCDGNVKGLILAGKDNTQTQDFDSLDSQIEQLNEQKNELLAKLSALHSGQLKNQIDQPTGVQVQKNMKVLIGFGINYQQKCIDLVLQSSSDQYFIKQAILTADSLFQPSEAWIHTEASAQQMIRIPLLTLSSNIKQTILAKVLLSNSPNSNQYLIAETKGELPKFSNYAFFCNEIKLNMRPKSYVVSQIKERVPRFVKWMDQCFIIDGKITNKLEQQEELSVTFQNIRTDQFLCIEIKPQNGRVQIWTESIDLAGEILQDLCNFINLSEMVTVAEFPQEMEKLKQTIARIELYKSAKLQISADLAESLTKIKTMIVQAEDSRMVNQLMYMKKMYANVMIENKLLQQEMFKKSSNNDKLMESLREINSMISKGAELRHGNPKNQVTQLCRAAVKKNNLYQLISIIQQGKEQ